MNGCSIYNKFTCRMALYGRGFLLKDASNNGYNAPSDKPLPAGPYTREDGILGYNEVIIFCSKMLPTLRTAIKIMKIFF